MSCASQYKTLTYSTGPLAREPLREGGINATPLPEHSVFNVSGELLQLVIEFGLESYSKSVTIRIPANVRRALEISPALYRLTRHNAKTTAF